MKIKYLKLKHWLLVSICGLLGITTGCSDDKDDGEIVSMYGCPEGTYHVSGTVTDEKGEPVEGIGVGRGYMGAYEGVPMPGTKWLDTTGPDGRYDVQVFGTPILPTEINFDDVDGEEHGLFRDTIITVSATREDFHGSDGSYNYGTAEITQDVVMRSADTENK